MDFIVFWMFNLKKKILLLILRLEVFSVIYFPLSSNTYQMSNNNQYQGCKEQRDLFGVLGVAVQETQIWGKSKECSKEESQELIKAKATQLLKLVFKNCSWLGCMKEIKDRLSQVI